MWLPALILMSVGGLFEDPPLAIGTSWAAQNQVSYLARPSYCIDHCIRGPLTLYDPQPGDIMLIADSSIFWKCMHHLAGSGVPNHSGILFRRPDGRMAVLEAGPHDTARCRTLDAIPHLSSYACEGRVWIRRRCKPLTCCQSAALTRFAMENDGARFATHRLAKQLTPLRTRGPLKTFLIGKPHGHRRSYFCSELVTEACVAAGMMCAETTRPSATYPRDLFMDRSLNPYINRHLGLYPCWAPPARWVVGSSCVCAPPSCENEPCLGCTSSLPDCSRSASPPCSSCRTTLLAWHRHWDLWCSAY